MNQLFITILNNTITASYLIIFIVLLRSVFRNMPNKYKFICWIFVGFRLLVPFSIDTIFSLIPNSKPITNQQIQNVITSTSNNNHIINTQPNTNIIKSTEIFLNVIMLIWVLGIVVFLIYTLYQTFKIKKLVEGSILLEDNIYLNDYINTPFILGLKNPRIYLPSFIESKDKEFVLNHERSHIFCKHHIHKFIGFICLLIHWFNPFVWIAYTLFSTDLELSCDEKVIQHFDLNNRKEYANTLVKFSSKRFKLAYSPLSFGEVSIYDRIKSILSYKSPKKIFKTISIILCILIGLCFLTNPKLKKNVNDELMLFLEKEMIELGKGSHDDGLYPTIDIHVYGYEETDEQIILYTNIYEVKYSYGLILDEESGSNIPTILTVNKNDNGYELVDVWYPTDGEEYAKSIRENFPITIAYKALSTSFSSISQKENCEKQAIEYYKNIDHTIVSYVDSIDTNHVLTFNQNDKTFTYTYLDGTINGTFELDINDTGSMFMPYDSNYVILEDVNENRVKCILIAGEIWLYEGDINILPGTNLNTVFDIMN